MSSAVSAAQPRSFVLVNRSAGCVGNSPLFWKRGGGGYTPLVDDAETFTLAAALAQIRSSRSSHRFELFSLATIERLAVRVVDSQELNATFRAVVSLEVDGGWSAAVCDYPSEKDYEETNGETDNEPLTTCGHMHQTPDNRAIGRCHRRLNRLWA